MNVRTLLFSLLFATGGAFAADPRPASSESVALAHLMAVNEHEIKAAEIAAGNDLSAPVADYAAMLRKEHGDNQAATIALPTAPAPGETDPAEVKAQKEVAAAQRQALSEKSGKEFETAYVELMIKDHAEALVMLDAKLIPAATTPSVKAHLTKTREHIAMHLEQAKALQSR